MPLGGNGPEIECFLGGSITGADFAMMVSISPSTFLKNGPRGGHYGAYQHVEGKDAVRVAEAQLQGAIDLDKLVDLGRARVRTLIIVYRGPATAVSPLIATDHPNWLCAAASLAVSFCCWLQAVPLLTKTYTEP